MDDVVGPLSVSEAIGYAMLPSDGFEFVDLRPRRLRSRIIPSVDDPLFVALDFVVEFGVLDSAVAATAHTAAINGLLLCRDHAARKGCHFEERFDLGEAIDLILEGQLVRSPDPHGADLPRVGG